MRYIGIDVSKKTFMVAFPNGKDFKTESFVNNPNGIRTFLKKLHPGEDQCIMEATGNYSMTLLYLLDKAKIAASMINPKQSKNFARMMLEVSKTDKRDACLLAMYGQKMEPDVYKMPSEVVMRLKQQRTVLRQLRQQRTAALNVKESIEVLPVVDKKSRNALNNIIIQLDKQIQNLEKDMYDVSSEEFETQLKKLLTIKGIGKVVATSLLIATNGFSGFDNAKQVSRYLGMCPTYQQSGTSIHTNGSISHAGDSQIRGQLYMAAMSAIRRNTACKEFYKRLRANGKSGKHALVAVGNKLIRQAFAVIKNGTPYIDGFVSKPPK